MAVRKASRLKDRVCQVCGNTFQSRKSNAKFCSPNCKSTDQRNRMKAVQNGLTIEQARVVIITPELIKVSKDRTCKVCGNTFQGIKGALFCSNACKQKDFRNGKNTDTLQLRETVTAQSSIIKNQAMVFNAIASQPAITQKLSVETGKDLTECKRPDGKHLYTDRDLWILLAKMYEVVYHEQSGNLLSVLNTNKVVDALIADFERRFECKFDDMKKANPHIKPYDSDNENYTLISRYSKLKYSR